MQFHRSGRSSLYTRQTQTQQQTMTRGNVHYEVMRSAVERGEERSGANERRKTFNINNIVLMRREERGREIFFWFYRI